jgi:metal-dependent amidase/aminoacylase/carboxypeptidase family protein
LERLGYTVRTGLGKTGVTGFRKAGKPAKSALIQTDIDALPILEEADVLWKSDTTGVMHAGGRDANTAIGVTAAHILMKELPSLSGNVLFVFQPAEEILRGGGCNGRSCSFRDLKADSSCRRPEG